MSIHPTAIIDETAEIDPSSNIGPYCVIEGPVRIGPNNHLLPHCYICGEVTIGAGNRIGPSAAIGTDPQDFKAVDGTGVVVGDDNIIREFSQIHRSTNPDAPTRVGNGVMIMATGHVAHDCVIGDNVILTNCALTSGHVTIDEGAILSSPCGIHQGVRIGRLAFVSASSAIGKDLPPFMVAEGRNRVRALNAVGMRRAGVSSSARSDIKRVYKAIYHSDMTVERGIESLDEESLCAEAREIVAFCRADSARGIMAHY